MQWVSFLYFFKINVINTFLLMDNALPHNIHKYYNIIIIVLYIYKFLNKKYIYEYIYIYTHT